MRDGKGDRRTKGIATLGQPQGPFNQKRLEGIHSVEGSICDIALLYNRP